VGIDAISPEASSQIEASLQSLGHRNGVEAEDLRADTIYDAEIGHLKVTLHGGVNRTAAALKLVAALLEK
jgi:hypothetical protein